jgi:hypothetical protein
MGGAVAHDLRLSGLGPPRTSERSFVATTSPTPAPAETASFRALAGARTAISPREAALNLARAWRDATGTNPNPATVAVLWAQWALETGRGRSMHGNNFGGLKGNASNGGSAVLSTREGYGESEQRIQARFRTYACAADGARDYVHTLGERYPSAFAAARDGDAARFAQALAAQGYFTADPRAYRASIASLSREYLERGPDHLPALTVEEPSVAQNALIWMLGRLIAKKGG